MFNSLLLVEDDPSVREAVANYLRLHRWSVAQADGLQSATQALLTERPDAALIDYSLPDGTGLELLARLKAAEPELPVILLTAHGSIDLAVQAVKEGAEQFFTKPIDLATLDIALRRAVDNSRNRVARRFVRTVEARDAPDPFVGDSEAIRRLRVEVEKILGSSRPVLLLGETGTGKGVLARWIHHHGQRADESFVDLNCAGLSRELLESELFGYDKGAFTGASGNKPGLLEGAHRGTLFLDEIGELTPEVQPKLLTVLEDQRFRRLGSIRDRIVDVKFVAATHHDLQARAAQGAFRSDLYYRISTFPLLVPPLRERGDDVLLLAEKILERIARELSRPGLRLSEAGQQALLSHAWPGNIRELRNVLERAALFAEDGVIGASWLFAQRSATASRVRPRTLEEAERAHVESVLREVDGKVEALASILGLSRSAAYEKLKKHGLSDGGSARARGATRGV